MKFFENIRERIDASLKMQEPEEQEAKKSSRLETVLRGSVTGSSTVSWGVVILVAFALYALVNLVFKILSLFN